MTNGSGANVWAGGLPGFYPVPFDPNRSILAGLTTVQLQANLAAAQGALQLLMTGGKIVKAEYDMGQGKQQVEYTPASQAGLTGWIMLLQAQLGINRVPRRPVNLIW